MKTKSKWTWIVLTLCIMAATRGLGQTLNTNALMLDPNLTYQEIVQYANPILDSLRALNGGVPTKEEKVFRRWQSFWAGRTGSNGTGAGGNMREVLDFHLRQAQGEFYLCNQGPAGSAWQFMGPDSVAHPTANQGIVNCLAQHPTDTNIVYAGCNFSGIFKTTNAGQNWRCVTEGLRLPILPVHAITLDPDNPDIIYAGTGLTEHAGVRFGIGIFKSTDAGTSWTHIWPTAVSYVPNAEVNVIRFHPTNHNVILTAGRGSIHRSTDRGQTWTQVFGNSLSGTVSGGDDFMDMEVCPSNPSVWLASTRENGGTTLPKAELYRSTDAGLSWQCVNCLDPAPAPFQHAVRLGISRSLQDGYLYVCFPHAGNGNPNGVVKTRDGINFIPVVTATAYQGPGFYSFVFEVSPRDSNRFYAGGVEFEIRAPGSNAFMYYGAGTVHADVKDLIVTPGQGADRLVLCTDGGVSVSNDSGLNWRTSNGRGLSIRQYYGFDIQQSTGMVVAGAQDIGTWRTQGAAWVDVLARMDGGWVEIDDHNENTTVYGTNEGWKNNIDNWATSFNQNNNQAGMPGPFSGSPMDRRVALDPLVPGKYWGGDAVRIKTLQADVLQPTWSPTVWTKPGGNTSHFLSDIAISPLNPKVMYWAYVEPCYEDSLVKNVFFRSMDGCTTATDISRLLHPASNPAALVYLHHAIADIDVDPHDPGHLMVGMTNYAWNSTTQQAVARVYESTDYGNTWGDISKGLPAMPVNHLLFQNGGGGVAFAATDGGVFRYNPTLREWECFNLGLPAARCSRVVIDYCRGRILVGTFGRGVWEAPLPSVPDHHVTSTQTWETGSINHFANNIVVNAGVTLTIKGKVFFAKDKKLIVHYGGKVILQGGTLTTICDDLWGGVDVRGISSLPQVVNSQGYDPNHGILQILAGGTIEHARVGVTTAFHDVLGNYYWNSFGGIVQCQSAKFLNNKIDVIMMPYSLQNRSYFRSCLFETNRLLKDNEKPIVHLSMWGVRKIPIEGCTFRYAAGNAYIPAQHGNGISGRDATYLVDWRCTAPGPGGCGAGTPTIFENLVYGIDHVCTNRLLSPSVRRSQFNRNLLVGLKLQNADYALIEDNVFDVGVGIANMSLGTGIYADRCSQYSLQSNQFKTTVGGAYGVIVNEGGDEENMVFNNSFTDLKYAISAQGDNEGPDPKDGLRMNCNDFYGGQYGIVVSGFGVGDAQGFDTQNQQTQRDELVRNRYYTPCAGSGIGENKFYIQLQPSTGTIEHRTNPNPECLPLPQPNCSDLALQVLTLPFPLDKPNDCKKESAPTPPIIQTQRLAAINELQASTATYNQLIDGANTTELLGKLATKNTSADITTLLMAYSPYLSDDVLLAFIARKATVIPSDYKTVLVANSPLTADVMSKVLTLDLPTPTLDAVKAAQTGISGRENARGNVAHWESELSYWQAADLQYALRDTLDSTANQKVLSIIERDGLGDCKTAFGKGLFDAWGLDDNLLQTIPGFGISNAELSRIGSELRSIAKTCAAMDLALGDTTHETKFVVLPAAYPQAQSLVEKYLTYANTEVQFQPDQELRKMDNDAPGALQPDLERLSIYPNPTGGDITVVIATDSKTTYQLRLTDLQGRLILERDLTAVAPNRIGLPPSFHGVAIYRVLQGGLHWKSGTLIVH